ncbi:hypothetical protein ACSSS7_005948 [Eimeria intestinalis]
MERPEAPTSEQLQQEKDLKVALKEAGVAFKEHNHDLALTVEELSAAIKHLNLPGSSSSSSNSNNSSSLMSSRNSCTSSKTANNSSSSSKQQQKQQHQQQQQQQRQH